MGLKKLEAEAVLFADVPFLKYNVLSTLSEHKWGAIRIISVHKAM